MSDAAARTQSEIFAGQLFKQIRRGQFRASGRGIGKPFAQFQLRRFVPRAQNP
jgi:hypothetical protein